MKLYKQKYTICLYDKDDENLLYMFDNVEEICELKEEIKNPKLLNKYRVLINKAIKRTNGSVKFINGKKMRLHVIDITEE